MIKKPSVIVCILIWSLATCGIAQANKHRIFVVSSYHREYLWSQDTQKGLCAALHEFGFIDSNEQAAEFTEKDYLESASAVLKKTWMDTKRKGGKSDVMAATIRVMDEISQFDPDIVLLGDDNAANYIGNQLVDTDTPVIFWGVNGTPLKYGLLDSLKKPGHNVTGVYQAGYLKECLYFLKKISPEVEAFAVLSDDSPTGRSKAKAIKNLHDRGELPLKLVDTVTTNQVDEWKSKAVELQGKVDAFFVLNHNSLKDANERVVDQLEIGAWYLRNISKPECAGEKQFAQEGMLSVCDDSGYNQGYEAMKLAWRILRHGERAGDIEVKAPGRGPFIVNRQRATALGIDIRPEMGVEEYIEESLALREHPITARDTK